MMTNEQKTSLIHRWKQNNQGMTLEDFIDSAQNTIGMDDAVIVKWESIWLAIEADGYTHS